MTVIDAAQREQALDIARSFIVQAPAGSGKTGVLTQRILKLLTQVERPEQILAITFTKKAAAEMRTRVAEALEQAAHGVPPEEAHARHYFDLASAVLTRDKQKNWQLLENLGRLRLQTIDSLCSTLVRESPLTAGLGAQFGVEEDASELYREATRALLSMLDEDEPVAQALFRVMSHFENQYSKVQDLIAQMLEQRDHWLGDISNASSDWEGFRDLLRQSLRAINDEAERAVQEQLTPTQRSELDDLTVYACNNLMLDKTAHALFECEPDTQTWRKRQWTLFQTQSRQWRKSFDRRCGFPPGESAAEKKQASEYKQRAKALVDSLDRAGPGFLSAVHDFEDAPNVELSAQEWQLLEDLTLIVRYAAAHLKLVFSQRRSVDFSEIALSALQALGREEAPSDVMLAMDDRIAHILVDEFQDTSFIQVELLEKLTAGWSKGDGRTLFLVGDPMQSIYAFRKADVGLFLKLWQEQTLGSVQLQRLQLCMNFRSSPVVLDWVNRTFAQAFPRRDDIRSGAVAYAESTPGKGDSTADRAELHLFSGEDKLALVDNEARWIAETIQALPADSSVAVLVKGKSHVIQIAAALRDLNIRYQAVEIESLADNQIITDLLSLYQVCLSPRDKTAWFALLRGPWCGLTLQELEQVAAAHSHPFIALQSLQTNAQGLDAQTWTRLNNLLTLIQGFYRQRLQQPFAEALRALALHLGMAATARSLADVEAMELFFQLVAEVEAIGGYPDRISLQKKLTKLFVPPEPLQAGQLSLQLMSMHKSKGLEFDVVFLPQLGRKSRADDKPLILVDKQTTPHARAQELFMAPAAHRTKSSDSVYEYLWKLRKLRSRNESARLLYVACTRARQQLYLSATLTLNKDGELNSPDSGSLLASIWPVVAANAVPHPVEMVPPSAPVRYFRRPSSPLAIPIAHSTSQRAAQSLSTEVLDTAETATDIQRASGTLLHRVLEIWARFPSSIPASISETLQAQWRTRLEQEGFAEPEVTIAVGRLSRALGNLLKNAERRYWLLECRHPESAVEYAIASNTLEGVQRWVVDRTFVSDGVRHIVDYKLAEPEGDLKQFLAQEISLYAPQLNNYREKLQARDGLPCRTYLYFPLIDHLQEVEA